MRSTLHGRAHGHSNAGDILSGLRIRNAIIETITAFFILLFAYVAISKLVDYDIFVNQLSKSPFMEKYANMAGAAIPSTELLVAFLLVFKKTRLAGLFAAFGLMLAFTFYIYLMLHFSYYIPCSCGGVLSRMSWDQHFWFNVAATILALCSIYLSIQSKRSYEV